MRNVTIELSDQAGKMLEKLVELGIYGATIPEVAGRFVDQELMKFIDTGQVRREMTDVLAESPAKSS